MILRVIGVGVTGLVAASMVTTAAAGVLVACALRRCAAKRAEWPEESPPADAAP